MVGVEARGGAAVDGACVMGWSAEKARKAMEQAVPSGGVTARAAPPVSKVLKPTVVGIADYERAWEVYRETPTTAAVKDALSVPWSMAESLVELGNAALGVRPLRERFQATLQEALRRAHASDATLLETIAAEARAAQSEAFGHVITALRQQTAHLAKGEMISVKELKDLWAIYEAAGRYGAFASGGPESRRAIVVAEEEMSRETMLAALMQAGLLGDTSGDVEPG